MTEERLMEELRQIASDVDGLSVELYDIMQRARDAREHLVALEQHIRRRLQEAQ